MLSVTVSFTYCVVTFFGLYRAIRSTSAAAELVIIVQPLWCFYFIVFILLVIGIGSGTAREVENIAIVYVILFVRCLA